MAQVPMIIAFEDARQDLRRVINHALTVLPAYQVEVLLKQFYDDVFKMAQQEYDASLARYKAELAQEEITANSQLATENEENIEEQE